MTGFGRGYRRSSAIASCSTGIPVNTLNVSFAGRVGAEILAKLDGVAASTGSACHAGQVELSPVLKAMRVAPEIGMGAIRFSLGRGNTQVDVDQVVEALGRVV